MSDNQKIQLPPRGIKGLKVWCPVCNTEVRECLRNKKGIEKCENKQKLLYRVCLYYKGSKKRKVVHLETKVLEEAIAEKLKIEREMKHQAEPHVKKQRVVFEKVKENQLKLVDGMSFYINYQNGNRGYIHERIARSPKHVANIEKTFSLFGKSMEKNGMDMEQMLAQDITGQEVGYFHEYLLKDMNYGGHTYNRSFTHLSGLISYLNKFENQELKNHFNKVVKKATQSKVTIIEPSDFKALLEAVNNPENKHKIMSDGKKRVFFYDFIPVAFKLALTCGIRREPLCYLKYSDIRQNEQGEPVAVISKNLKVNRIQSSSGKSNIERSIPTPITPALKRVLYEELNFEINRNSEKFLIGNDSGLKREFIVSVLSKSFAHFWEKTGIKKKAEFSDLRKTFINKMQMALGDNSRHVTGHASSQVMDTHYLSKDFFVGLANNQNIFPELEIGKQEERQEELKKTRKQKNTKSQNKSIEH